MLEIILNFPMAVTQLVLLTLKSVNDDQPFVTNNLPGITDFHLLEFFVLLKRYEAVAISKCVCVSGGMNGS